MEVIYKVTGLEELDRKLATLTEKLQKKLLKQACKSGALAILHTARSLTPVRSGALVADERVVPTQSRSQGTVGYKMIVGGKGFFQGKQFYGGFQEFGWRVGKRTRQVVGLQRAISRSQQRRNIFGVAALQKQLAQADQRPLVEGVHYMQRAADQNRQVVIDLFRETLANRLGELCGDNS